MDPKIKIERLRRLKHLIKIERMPKGEYRLLHKSAQLSPKDKQLLIEWSNKLLGE